MKAALTLLAYDDSSSESSSDDEDYLLLHLVSFLKRRLGMHLNLEDLSNMEYVEMFRFVHVCLIVLALQLGMDVHNCCIYRFSKEDMVRLASALNLPDVYICKQGTRATGMEALMVMLRRLSYPNRFCDLTATFGRDVPELSLIFSTVSKLKVKIIYIYY